MFKTIVSFLTGLLLGVMLITCLYADVYEQGKIAGANFIYRTIVFPQ